MNAFDFVITFALGSALSGITVNKNIPLAGGFAANFTFIGLHYLFAWSSVRIKVVKALLISNPTLIFYKGKFLHPAM